MALSPAAVIGIGAALDLIRFVISRRDLQNKSPEEIMEAWAAQREEWKDAVAQWKASKK